MASRKTGGRRQRVQHKNSNVFAMFGQDEIQELKEAFNLIDQNHDGFIDSADLHNMFASLGRFYWVFLPILPYIWYIYIIVFQERK